MQIYLIDVLYFLEYILEGGEDSLLVITGRGKNSGVNGPKLYPKMIELLQDRSYE